MEQLYIRKATVQDVKTIHGLLMQFSKQGFLLPRSYNDLYNHLRDIFVLASVEKGPIKGCCSLAITWDNLAEIRSLGVIDELQGRGWGKRLVEACLSEAVTLGLFQIFTLTYQADFFRKVGFEEVSKDVLPQKVWSDCIKCPKFPDCDEIAMMLKL